MTDDQEIFAIAYFSSSRVAWSEDELADLLRVCRNKNEMFGVSGFLIYVDGSFLQWLEGPPEGLNTVFGRISSDPRHHQVSKVFHGSLGQRYFSQWSMAYISQANLSDEMRSEVADISELRRGGGFLKDAPRLAQRVTQNFLRFNRS